MITTIAVFGGSGATGRQIIKHALAKGLSVRMLARNAKALADTGNCVETTVGSILNAGDVERTLRGSDAVICVFGSHPPYTDIFCADATRTITSAMRQLGIARIICQTGAMIGHYPHNRTPAFRGMVWLFNRKTPALAQDRAKQEEIIQHSGLEWTLVKPPRLTDRRASGCYAAGPNLRVGMLSALAREDLAAFTIRELEERKFMGKAVFVRNSHCESR